MGLLPDLCKSRSLRHLGMSLLTSAPGSEVLKEGSATIRFTKGQVFYNPVQQFNRDLSVAALTAHSLLVNPDGAGRINVFEGLSATGLRAIRYAREVPGIALVLANDLDPFAVGSIRNNIEVNAAEDPKVLEKVKATQGDANKSLHTFLEDIDVVDLDPYGSAAPFIDAAVQRVKSGGLLCVTCTDLAVLCATHEETCFAKYGGLPLRGDVCHEGVCALGILIIGLLRLFLGTQTCTERARDIC